MNTACGIFFLFGIVLITILNLGWKKIGLGLEKLVEASIIMILANLFFVLIGLLLNQFGMEVKIFRNSYSFYAIINNWIVTGLGEELVFAGVLYTMILRKNNRKILYNINT